MNFAGVDCSIDLTKPPVLKKSIQTNNTCDRAKGKNCSVIALIGENLPNDGSDLSIAYEQYAVYNFYESLSRNFFNAPNLDCE